MGTLIELRRGGSHLFLRYSFPDSKAADSWPIPIRAGAVCSVAHRFIV